ncbi:uncharacterized protein LOC131288934 [Anopheles ziemanni]|uniref:uncharacterized protein LOC131259953 n=1 Tax=Anopheles coustani TaxID=139045 RepID=UPI00265AFCF2|nr:uncharacterized protein LOC131259953 [Anopheles coustani]XP_058174099.1 uncharacterized protein LOC131288934 [Anopheles ziemanni]
MASMLEQPRHVYDVLRPVLILSKVFGFNVFELQGEPPYVQMKVTRANYASLLFNFVGNSFCVFLNTKNRQLSKLTGSAVMNSGLSFLFPFGAIVFNVLAVDSFFRRRTTCAIIAEFFEFDRSLQRKNYQVAHKDHLRVLSSSLIVSVLMIVVGTLYSLLMALISSFSLQNHVINAFSYFYTGVQFLIINFQFICAARLVSFRLNDIDRCLKRHWKRGQWCIEQNNRWGRKLEPMDVVEELAGDVAALVRIVERVNRVYANQILGCIVGLSMFGIFVIYAAAYSYYTGTVEEKRLTTILVATSSFYVIVTTYVFRSGVAVANGNKAIIQTLNKAILSIKDRILKTKLLCFSQQLLHRAPRLQSLFCEFNVKTIFSICGFIVTYLIILVQFDETSHGSFTGIKAQ